MDITIIGRMRRATGAESSWVRRACELTRQLQTIERKRAKDERELINRYKVFAKLQTALDFEVLVEGLICELQPDGWFRNLS